MVVFKPKMMSYHEFLQFSIYIAFKVVEQDWPKILMIFMVLFASMLSPIVVVRMGLFLFACLDITRNGFKSKVNTITTIHSKVDS